MLSRVFVAATLLASCVALAPSSSAQVSGGDGCAFNQSQTVAAAVGIINGGTQNVYAPFPGCRVARSSTQVFTFDAQYSGPFVAGIGTVTWGTSSFSGCTVAALTVTTNNFAAAASSRAATTITMTSGECRGFINFDISIGSPVVFDWAVSVPVNIRVEQPNQMYLCGPTGLTDNAFNPSSSACNEQLLALCNADGAGGTVCNDPLFQALAFLCGNTGGAADAVSVSTTACGIPNLDEEVRTCAASGFGAACTTPLMDLLAYACNATGGTPASFTTSAVCNQLAISVANSGTQHLVVDAWPASPLGVAVTGSLATAVSQSGAWTTTTTVQGGSTPVQLGGTLQELVQVCANGSFSPCSVPTLKLAQSGNWSLSLAQNGVWTVADDANGWAVHQDPLTGNVSVDGLGGTSAALRDVAEAIRQLRLVVNQTLNGSNFTSPDTLHLCGVTCESPVRLDGSVNATVAAARTGQLPQAWWCLFLACVLLAVAVMPEKKNYAMLTAAALFFLAAAAVTPFGSIMTPLQEGVCRVLVAILGLFLLVSAGFEIHDGTVGARRRAAEEDEYGG